MTEINSEQDNLRTRIAKALYGQILAPVRPFDSQSSEVKGWWLEDADAVIRELGLKADGCPCTQRGPNCAHRYVTDWASDDE